MSEHDENIMYLQLTPCRPEDKSTVQAISAAPTATYDGNNAKAAVDNGAKRKRRTMSQIQNLKDALASSYKEGIPLPVIAKKLKVRIELVYRLIVALQEEGKLPTPSANQTIIEPPKLFKAILNKAEFVDTGLLKIEKTPDGTAFTVTPVVI